MFFFLLFSSLFCPVLQRPLFPPCRVLKPPPLHRTSPLKPRKSRRRHCLIRGHISKICFFSSFFRFFSDQCCRDLFSPHAGSSNPHLSTVRRPSNLASPAAAIAGTQVKICLFRFFFFRSFFDQCYRDPLYPTRRVLNPPPLHHIIPTPISRPSSLASPRRHRR